MYGQSVSSNKERTSIVILVPVHVGSLNTHTSITNIAVDVSEGIKDSTSHGPSSPILVSMTLWTEKLNTYLSTEGNKFLQN
jgi:hypothetical protein